MAVSSIGDTYFTNYSTEANDAVSQKMTSQRMPKRMKKC